MTGAASEARRGALRAGLFAVLLSLVAGASQAHAADLCGEATRIEQPRADESSPLAETAYSVWERVYGTVFSVTGRATEIVLLGEPARMANGQPFPPNAFICPSQGNATPRIYVTWPMLTLVQQQKLYDVDFLALVIGHELGHRVNDLDWNGAIAKREAGATGAGLEAKADVRGAFFAAAAGYSTRRLACDDALDLFLNVEANVQDDARAQRKLALGDVLRTFDVYESLYDASSALVFWNAFRGKSLLKWVDQYLTERVQVIPEFKVLAALAILMNAADQACWTDVTNVPEASATALRCVPVYPSHTAFWDHRSSQKGESRACGSAVDREIGEAISLLQKARSEGADDLVVNNGLACAYAYLADTGKATNALDNAVKALPASAPPAIGQALEANRAFIDWIAWMRTSPAPEASADAAAKGAWGKKLAAAAAKWRPNPELTRWLDRVKAYPTVASETKPAPFMCEAEPPKPDPGVGMSRLPSFPRDARSGGCPCGWSELHFLENPFGNISGDGVRTCVPAGWAVGQRWVDVELAREQVPATKMLIHDVIEGPIASLRTWQKGCRSLEARGVGNDGGRVFAGLCPDLGAAEVVLVVDDCRVRRAVLLKGP